MILFFLISLSCGKKVLFLTNNLKSAGELNDKYTDMHLKDYISSNLGVIS
jgi:hypothetical protein